MSTKLLLLLLSVIVPLDSQVRGQFSGAANGHNQKSDITEYIFQRLLGNQNPSLDKQSAEEQIFSDRRRPEGAEASIVYPQFGGRTNPIRRYLDEAKDQIDVIDFRRPRSRGNVRVSRKDYADRDDLVFSDGGQEDASRRRRRKTKASNERSASSSEQVPIKLAFPGNDFQPKSHLGCTNCVDGSGGSGNQWTMPLQSLGDKQYYFGVFFKANWYKAEQYCRFHGMHLASINSAEEQKILQEHIQAYGMGQEHFWTSGTDQGEEGKFFWMSTGRPITYTNWNAGEPNNFEYDDGEQEHCLEMWDRDGKGLGWNDTPCSFQTFFICEISF